MIIMKRVFAVLFTVSISAGILAQEKITDPRDGNIYRTVKVAGTTWMAENLKFIPEGTEALCFDNNPGNLASYGVLYDWKTALKVCPEGWHLPSGNDYHSLIDNIVTPDNGRSPSSGPDLLGFQLAGMKNYEGIFTEMDEGGYYWTSTEYDPNEAEFFSCIIVNGNSVLDISRKADMPDIHGAEKSNKYSVRCIKDENP